jgi:laminin alpha 3/5
LQYEAEDGMTPDRKPVRFAIDTTEFPDYSWRGFAVFSPIQDEIQLDVEISKPSVYRLLLVGFSKIDSVIVLVNILALCQSD